MLSHIAEETTRLAHAFLGALFSFIIIVAESNFWPVAILCFAMYAVFVVNTSALHRVFALSVLGNSEGVLWMVLLFVVETLVIAAVFFVYAMDMESYFQARHVWPLLFGMVVYIGFLGLMNLSHAVEIFDLNKKKNKNTRAAAEGAHT